MAFLADVLKIGVIGPEFRSGNDYPSNGTGCDCPIGSYFSCRTDGSWWLKVGDSSTAWVQLRTIASINGDSVDLIPGMPVVQSDDVIVRAQADSQAGALAIGIVVIGAAPTLIAQILPVGLGSLTTAQWDAVTGQLGGLTPGASYFLGLGPGTLTTTPPSLDGQIIARIGHAVSPTGMLIGIQPPIFL